VKIRDDVLVSADDLGTSGTKIYDLDYGDLITALDLRFGATNGATDNKNNPVERNITKIEIVDGGEVLWSLPGDVAYALSSQLLGTPGDEYFSGKASDGPYCSIPILFGREMYDPEFSFNPRAFKNPQLKVTFDEATVRAASATGFSSDSFTLTVVVNLMEDAPTPRAFLKALDVYDYTSLASGDTTVDMPGDYPYRMIFVRNYEAGQDVRGDINNYKLSCDGGKFIPFDLAAANLISRMMHYFPMTVKNGMVKADDGDAFQTWMGMDIAGHLQSQQASRIVACDGYWPGQFTVYVYTDAGASTTDVNISWGVHGYCPHNVVFYPFGRLDTPSDWFDPRQYGTVKLYLTNNGADGEVNVCVQQERTY